jgi:prolyl-tRNA editing enzyme YbaK/EbsC (Cys-tRNA(Pro) deacylase)
VRPKSQITGRNDGHRRRRQTRSARTATTSCCELSGRIGLDGADPAVYLGHPARLNRLRAPDLADLRYPGVQKVVEVASRKGVILDIHVMRAWTISPTAEEIAAEVGAHVGRVVQSLMCVAPRPQGKLVPSICLVSGLNQPRLEVLAAVTGEVAIRVANAREARESLGYSAGAVPPFGHGRDVQIVMDRDLCSYEWVWASTGMDSAVFRVAPRTLQMLANAMVVPLTRAS